LENTFVKAIFTSAGEYLAIFLFLNLVGIPSAIAQISPDGTLSTTVSSDGQNFVINNGDRVGNNLFHSFRDFSIPTGGSATFSNAIDIQNIFGRVTGGNISNIDGLLATQGRTNLFLLNPNGIIFGTNARLNIGGAFIGSTAERLQFSDGTEFNTRAGTPQLTISAPVGLQLGRNAGAIQVNGLGNQEIVPTTSFGLATVGSTLGLVGGNVRLNGGVVSGIGGRVEVGAVTDGIVSLTPIPLGFRLGYDRVSAYGDIALTNRSSLWNPASNPAGGIQVQGRNISLDNSQIAVAVTPDSMGSGGALEVRASESLRLGGTSPTLFPFSSWIASQVSEGVTGNGGSVQVTAPDVTLRDGARIQSLNLGSGVGGHVAIAARRINLSGYVPINSVAIQEQQVSSQISSVTAGAGRGGDIQVESDRLNLQNGGLLLSLVTGSATGGGDIRVRTSVLRANGGNPLNLTSGFSGVSSLTLGSGAGGDVDIEGDRIHLLNGASLGSATLSSGQGGAIQVRVREQIIVRNPPPFLPAGSGGVGSTTSSSGDAGSIRINAPWIRLVGGSDIASYSFMQTTSAALPGAGEGNAGDIQVNARQIDVVGYSANVPENTTNLSSISFGSGDAGDVSVFTRDLRVRNGGVVSTNMVASIAAFGPPLPTAGTGRGGNLTIDASGAIEVVGINEETGAPSGIAAFTFAEGDAGNATIRTPRLVVRDGATVGAFTAAGGDAGSLTIDAAHILVQGKGRNGIPSEISSNARVSSRETQLAYFLPSFPTGDTGRLTINAETLRVENGGAVTVEHSGTGNAGRLRINADQVSLSNQGRITAATALGGGGNIRLNSDRLLLSRQSTLSATARGAGDGGNLAIASPFIVSSSNSDIIANAERGNGGRIDITASAILGSRFRPRLTPNSDITASSQFGVSGSVNITTLTTDVASGLVELPEDLPDSSQQITASCLQQQESRFIITGQGGIPSNPVDDRGDDRPWSDMRDLSPFTTFEVDSTAQSASLPDIKEATAWQIGANGQIELVAGEFRAGPRVATCAAAD
jgi:filamentous hemagglutinin family protein